MNQTPSSSQWIALTLATLTGVVVFALSFLTNPVLFGEISADLDLTIVELGFVWGTPSSSGPACAAWSATYHSTCAASAGNQSQQTKP